MYISYSAILSVVPERFIETKWINPMSRYFLKALYSYLISGNLSMDSKGCAQNDHLSQIKTINYIS